MPLPQPQPEQPSASQVPQAGAGGSDAQLSPELVQQYLMDSVKRGDFLTAWHWLQRVSSLLLPSTSAPAQPAQRSKRSRATCGYASVDNAYESVFRGITAGC